MPLAHLPPEILSSICSNLDFKSSCQLRLTCKIFSDIAASGVFDVVYFGFLLESLEKLRHISEHAGLRGQVKKLIVCGESLNLVNPYTQYYDASESDDFDVEPVFPDYIEAVPNGVTLEDLNLGQYLTITEHWPSTDVTAPCPVRMYGPNKHRHVCLRERGFERTCAFYDSQNNRVTYSDWCHSSMAPKSQEQIDLMLLQHYKYAFEQIAWPKIAADELNSILPSFKSLREVVISPTSVRFQQSEPFWHNMRSALCRLPATHDISLSSFQITQPAIDCFLKSIASHGPPLSSLELLIELPKSSDKFQGKLSDIKRIFQHIQKLSLGLTRNFEERHGSFILSPDNDMLSDIFEALKGAHRLSSLNLWFQEREPGVEYDTFDVLKLFADSHWSQLRELTLGYFRTTEESLSQLLSNHTSTLRSLDLKSILFNKNTGQWQSFIPTLPELLPNLDWFWADNLMDETTERENDPTSLQQTSLQRLELPLDDAIQYREHRRRAQDGGVPMDDVSAEPLALHPVFNPVKWPPMCEAAIPALLEKFRDLWTANGFKDETEDTSDANAQFHRPRRLRRFRRQMDNLCRREHGL